MTSGVIKDKHKKRFCSKILIYLFLFISSGVALLAAGAIFAQVIFLTTPQRNYNIGTLSQLPHKNISLTTGDGLSISGWYLPGSRPQGIVLVHGIHANRAYLVPQAVILAEAGYHILLIDLRGHGQSAGELLTYGYDESLDVRAAVDYLAALHEIDQVGALGHSLGAAAVVREAAADRRLEAIVVQSSYSSLTDAVADSFENFVIFPRWPFAPLIIALAEYRTQVNISQVDSARDLAAMPARPVLIIHSEDDTLFPVHHAQKMYSAAKAPKFLWTVSGIGHINPIVGNEAEYKEQLLNFFDDAFSE